MTKWIMIIDDSDEKEDKVMLRKRDDGNFYAKFLNYAGECVEFPIKPIKEPAMVVTPTGVGIYITQGYIDAMIEFEEQQKIKEYFERFSERKDVEDSMWKKLKEVDNGTETN